MCDVLERLARIEDPTATVWKGPGLPEEDQGIKVLGSPLGHPAFVARHLERTSTKHQVLLDRIPLVQDVQSAWLLLLHCACARANYLLRVVRPSAAVNFAETHDRAVWQCLANILRTDLSECSGAVQDAATLPFALGGLGLRKATRVSGPAHWASWADCLTMIHSRHPLVATVFLHHLEGAVVTPCLSEAREIAL